MIKIDQLERKAVTFHLQEKIGTFHDQGINVGLEGRGRNRRRKRLVRKGNRGGGGDWRTRKTNLAETLATSTSDLNFEVGNARRSRHPTIETAVPILLTNIPKLVTNSPLRLIRTDRGAGGIKKGRKERANPGRREEIVSLRPGRTTISSTMVRGSRHGRARENVPKRDTGKGRPAL